MKAKGKKWVHFSPPASVTCAAVTSPKPEQPRSQGCTEVESREVSRMCLQMHPLKAVVSLPFWVEPKLQNPGGPGFPGGAVVENPPANAGDTGSSPGPGGSHTPRSNWAREPQLLSMRLWSLCSAKREAATVRGPRTAMKSGPRLLQLEKALAQKRRPKTAINK